MNAKTRQTIALVTRAYCELDVLNNIQWRAYRDELFALALAEEKQHRSADFSKYHPEAVSIKNAACAMSVLWIARYLTGGYEMPTVKHVLTLKPSVILAAALVANYREEITKAWEGIDQAALLAIDYSSLVSPEKQAA